jgi:protein O-GlcNAc transferase
MHGFSLHQQGNLDRAKAAYEQVLVKQPRHFDALHLLGVIAALSKNPSLAAEWISKAIQVDSTVAAAHSNLGGALKALARFEEAIVSYDRAIRLTPNLVEAYSNRGNALRELGRLDEAMASYDRAIALKPDYFDAHFNRGNALQDLSRFNDALASYERAIDLEPDRAEAYYNRGVVLSKLKRLDEALASYACAIRLKPDHADAYVQCGDTFKDLGRLQEALAIYDLAVRLQPESATRWNSRGIVLYALRRYDEALTSFERAIAIKPDYAAAHLNMGASFKEIGRLQDALALYDRAIAIKSDYAEAYLNRGNTLKDLKRLDEARVSFERALELKPDYEFLLGTVIHTRRLVCDWVDHEKDEERLRAGLEKRQTAALSFIAVTTLDAPELQRIAAEVWMHSKCPARTTLGPLLSSPANQKIRLGYFSADFHDHATCCLMAELFESHDKERFELFAFSFGPDTKDEMRQRVSRAFDRFIDVRFMSDMDVARMARELGIDIAIDLKGYTQDGRPGIFSYRCAPVQVNYLGYPGTMGAQYMDYLIADKVLIPTESQTHYTEKIVYLPHSYQVNDTRRAISDRTFTKAELGLPEVGFVFCCFNNNYKITPTTFDGWMRILKAVKSSILWLLEDNASATENLQREAQARGVQASRLIFAKRMPLSEHLARHRLADLFLDTRPCNAHTTCSDALWAGLPVLTLPGASFAARVSASLLQAMELPQLIARSEVEYERLAIDFALNPSRLTAFKEKLASKRLTAPLYNTQLFTQHLESAYRQMYQRHRDGCVPEAIFVDS